MTTLKDRYILMVDVGGALRVEEWSAKTWSEGDWIEFDGKLYVATETGVQAGDFATNLALGKWQTIDTPFVKSGNDIYYNLGNINIGTTLETSAAAFHYGDPSTDTAWKIVRDGTKLSIQRREMGSYAEKGFFDISSFHSDVIHVGTVKLEDKNGCLGTNEFHAHGKDGVSGYYKMKHGTTPATHKETDHSILWVDSSEKLYFEKADGTDIEIAFGSDFLKKDGSVPLTSDWDIGDTRKILADEIRARDADGLKLYDDSGKGIFVEDGGKVGIGLNSPDELLHLKTVGGNSLQYALKLQNPDNTNGGTASGILFKCSDVSGINSKGGIAFERTLSSGRGKIHFLLNNINDGTTVSLSDAIMTITPGGGVGFGTSPDNAWLHIKQDGSGIGFVKIEDTQTSGQTLWINNGNGSAGGVGKAGLYYGAGGQIMSFEASTGNIGINNTTPGEKLDIAGSINLTGVIKNAYGAVGAPAYSFSADPDTGMYRNAANSLAFATGGANRLIVDSNQVQATTKFLAPDGAVDAPTYSFSSDPDTGIYLPGGDILAFTAGGVSKLRINSAGQIILGANAYSTSRLSIRESWDSVTAPMFAMYNDHATLGDAFMTMYTPGAAYWSLGADRSSSSFVISNTNNLGSVALQLNGTSNCYIPAIYTDTTATDTAVHVGSNGVLRRYTSSRKIKSEINYNGVNSELALQFKPVSFKSKVDNGISCYGFIAEDMRDIDSRFATDGGKDDLPGIDINAIVAALTMTVQSHQKRINELVHQINLN